MKHVFSHLGFEFNPKNELWKSSLHTRLTPSVFETKIYGPRKNQNCDFFFDRLLNLFDLSREYAAKPGFLGSIEIISWLIPFCIRS